MIRKIIKIDEDKCNGCGLCSEACHKETIVMVNGKAKLLQDDYCDGLGNCLPARPAAAITFEERKDAAYDGTAFKVHMAKVGKTPSPGGCSDSNAYVIRIIKPASPNTAKMASQLVQWPLQIKLVSIDGAAYAYDSFHSEFMRNKTTLISCLNTAAR